MLFDGEVTTTKQSEDIPVAQGRITLQDDLPKFDINVTFNGQDYTLPYGNGADGDYWGELDSNDAPSFTNYQLFIGLSDGDYFVVTPEAGTYSLKIWGEEDESPTTPVE